MWTKSSEREEVASHTPFVSHCQQMEHMLLTYLLAYNNAFLGFYEQSHEVSLLHTGREIRTRYGTGQLCPRH